MRVKSGRAIGTEPQVLYREAALRSRRELRFSATAYVVSSRRSTARSNYSGKVRRRRSW